MLGFEAYGLNSRPGVQLFFFAVANFVANQLIPEANSSG